MSFSFAAAEFDSFMLGYPRFRRVEIPQEIIMQVALGTDYNAYSDGATTLTFVGNVGSMQLIVACNKNNEQLLDKSFSNFSEVLETALPYVES